MMSNLKRFFSLLLVLSTFVYLILPNVNGVSARDEKVEKSRVVVKLKCKLSDTEKENLVNGTDGEVLHKFKIINSIAVNVTKERKEKIRKHPCVENIEDDVVVSALAKKPVVIASSQTIPWGVSKIKAPQVWATTRGDGVKVAVIDTGIDLTHPDLAGNIKGGYNAIKPTRSANDDNGHGSHVAGIIAAVDNSVGVVGVGPKISLYAVKVLDRNGSGWMSDVVEGIDWSVQNGMQVTNMSLGTSSDSPTLHDAIIAAYNKGIVQVAAAGNSGPGDNTVIYPAKYSEVVAVGAVDSSNKVPYWSSRGPEVDLAAPGVSIYSTYKSGRYATMSGTSMASPHVAGVAASVIATHPSLTVDQVVARMKSNAQILTSSSTMVGSGLIDDYLSVTAP